ncbi:MAG: HU family DNA-binding protein, partial [Candidatus Latescibacterota bacterium]
VKDTKPKPAARNPRTGEVVYVPARRKTHFKPGKQLKEALHSAPSDHNGEAGSGSAVTPSEETENSPTWSS